MKRGVLMVTNYGYRPTKAVIDTSAIQNNVQGRVNVLQGGAHAVIQGQGAFDCSHRITTLKIRLAAEGSVFPALPPATAVFAFKFFRLLLFMLHPFINGGDHKSPLLPGQGEKFMG